MARPKKKTADKQTRRLPHIRCTEAEYNSIQGKADRLGMTMSQYVRHMAFNGQVVVNDNQPTQFDFAFVDQLRRIGVNINQQTKALNSTGAIRPELPILWGKLETILDHILETIEP